MEYYIKLLLLKNSCIVKTEKRKISKELFNQFIYCLIRAGVDFELTSRKNKTISIYCDDELLNDLRAFSNDFTKLKKRYIILEQEQ